MVRVCWEGDPEPVLELRDSLPVDASALDALLTQGNGEQVLWMVVATGFVMFMQAGFLLLEAGSVRSKNTINVAQKNVTDMVLAGCIFLTFGATLMFGAGSDGLFGFGGFDFSDTTHQPMLIYQFGFCAAAATIVSGAIAERMAFRAYVVLTIVIAAMVYPLFGHLVWGDAVLADNPAWLADMGFLDFAGGSVVHIVGGAAALGACIAIGPRLGRFDAVGKPLPMPGHSSVIALTGVILLAVSWIGFNAGTTQPGTREFTQVVVNTVVALCFGGLSALGYDLVTNPRAMQPKTTATGILGGLVAITPACAYVDFYGAIALGLIGGTVATLTSEMLLRVFKVDDPVDAVATHAGAGFAGTVLLAVFAQPEHLTGSWINQLTIQALGASVAFTFAFVMSFGTVKLMSLFMAVRVSAEDEEIGLNIAEHNIAFETDDLRALLRDRGFGNAPQVGGSGEQSLPFIGAVLAESDRIKAEMSANTRRLNDWDKVGSDWMWETDADLHLTYINQKFHDEMGDKAKALIGQPYHSFFLPLEKGVHDQLRRMRNHEAFDDRTFKVTGLPGRERFFSVSAIPQFGDNGAFEGYRGRARDVTDRFEAEREIRFLAHHDLLTGLYNRKSFTDFAAALLADNNRCRHGAVVMSLDLDGFKGVNDTHGHQAGDKLLQEIAKRLQDIVGETGIIARFGGDEFVAAMPLGEDGFDGIETLANAMIKAVRTPVIVGNLQLTVGTSVGTARYPTDSRNLDELTRFSDMALYDAKADDDRSWVPFNMAMQAQMERRQRLEHDMLGGIRDGQFYILYQPQVDIGTAALTGFEALVRWRHPALGELSPYEFIQIAEDTGFITELGNFVLRDACRMATQWPRIGDAPVRISVNVSPRQFFGTDLLGEIRKVLAETGLQPSQLEIEITEGTLVRDADEAIAILEKLRSLGVSVAVDDFGTGYSSLSYLQRFPIDRLKIDRAFVMNLENSLNDQRITNAVADLGRCLNLNVIAEGVETPGQVEVLRKMACNEIQGYLISPPVSALETMTLIGRSPFTTTLSGMPDAADTDNVDGNDTQDADAMDEAALAAS